MQELNFTQLVNKKRSQLVLIEVVMIFLVNLFVSWLRFDMDLKAVLFQYPAVPKIFVYPFFWYFCLSLVHGWDRTMLAYGNELFSRALGAAWRSLFIFSTFAYLIKFPISRIWVVSNVFATALTLLLIRLIIRRSLGLKHFEEGGLSYLYVGVENSAESSLEEFKSNFGFSPNLVILEPPANQNWDEWMEIYKSRSSEKSMSGVIIGYGQVNDGAILKQISEVNRNLIVEFILISRISPLLNRFEALDNPTLLRVKDSSILGSGAVLKRLFDVIFSVVAILVLSPLLVITALIIKLTSKGPILYVDKRIGKDGRDFIFPKFRSMYQGSDKKRLEVLGRPDTEMFDRYKKDPRITPFGRFIRRWSIDELPQLWSVLIGSMSIVGPRPILREELVQIKRGFESRFIAKPGLTGLWQVTGRKEVAWDDRMLRDIAYIEDWSLVNDLVLILKTISAIVSGRGAH